MTAAADSKRRQDLARLLEGPAEGDALVAAIYAGRQREGLRQRQRP